MTIDSRKIGDVVISPHSKGVNEAGEAIYDQLVCNGDAINELTHPTLYAQAPGDGIVTDVVVTAETLVLNTSPTWITVTENYIWILSRVNSSPTDCKLIQLDKETGLNTGFSFSVKTWSTCVFWDGTHLLVGGSDTYYYYGYTETGVSTADMIYTGTKQAAGGFDGEFYWTYGQTATVLRKYDSSRNFLATYAIPAGYQPITGIAFIDGEMYLGSSNSGTIAKFDPDTLTVTESAISDSLSHSKLATVGGEIYGYIRDSGGAWGKLTNGKVLPSLDTGNESLQYRMIADLTT